ncbi:hypothetical protein DFJ58DRAFT_29493 [Suillus subalutaceus]|uniref:uncharacterized protein n=1 Tax=Suillus subalutaceus TaxID=48586 RepID=UPI001B87B7DD|nr:uncharacterized protein DFJ58DRAFT_29493 [Suillus subalutaceus]KAG1844342.1 hypothetical protein DFJ58DRAFT_29493 [Suillus subalutaceus]
MLGSNGLHECWFKLPTKTKRYMRLLIFTWPLMVRYISAFSPFSTSLSMSDPAQDANCIYGAMGSKRIIQTHALSCKSVQVYTNWRYRSVAEAVAGKLATLSPSIHPMSIDVHETLSDPANVRTVYARIAHSCVPPNFAGVVTTIQCKHAGLPEFP